MKKLSLKGFVVALTTVSLMTSQGFVLAEGAKAPVARTTKAATAADIRLTSGGTLTGRVVDHAGTPLEGAEVVVRQGKAEVARTVTDERGVWSVKSLNNGMYQASSGNTSGVFRVWSEQVAPPAAKGQALLVMGENGARGQFAGIDPTTGVIAAAVVAGAVASVVLINQDEDPEDPVTPPPLTPAV